jgi:hypothetical protein
MKQILNVLGKLNWGKQAHAVLLLCAATANRGLIRINPMTCSVSVDAALKGTEYAQYDGLTLREARKLDRESLRLRWGAADA